jgi:hypothetical protein
VISYWFDMQLIGVATGPELGDVDWMDAHSQATLGPDWLEEHAEDRGTHRANGETDTLLRQRVRTPPDAITRRALLDLSQKLVDASGVTGTVGMVELPRDAAYLGKYTQDTGTGGVFTKSSTGDVMTFVPTVPFAYPPFFGGISGRVKTTQIVLSGSSSSGNDGSFQITGLVPANDTEGWPTLTGATFVNVNGVAGADATVTWHTERHDYHGALMDGFARCFADRGYRAWRANSVEGGKKAMGGMILILPYGTTEGTRLSVREMLRKFKAAGFLALVERRMIP